MASARQIARLVTTCGSVSSGAVRTAMGRTRTPTGGLDILPDLMRLLAETTCVASHSDEQTTQRVASYLARLVLRYGTVRRAFDALSSGRRRHALISNERANAWAQVLSVTPAAIEHTLARQSWLRIHLAKWSTAYGPTLVQKLADFDAWLDGPLPDTDGARTDRFPPDAYDLVRATPVYESIPGFADDVTGARALDDLPPAARGYLGFIQGFVGVPIRFVSIGPDREESIAVGGEL